MNSETSQLTVKGIMTRRETRALALNSGAPLLSADMIGLCVLALFALCVFEGAAWLATVPLATLVYLVASTPAVLFLVAVLSERKR